MLETPRKILVTGGAGFIGSHLVDCLLEKGHTIFCVDDFNDFYDPKIKKGYIMPHLSHSRYTLLEADIQNREKITRLFTHYRPEIVVHLAARAGVRPSLHNPFLYTEVNVGGTLNILEAAIKVGVKKLVFGSSSSVYGINQKIPFQEDDALLTPLSPYAATKLAGEAYCHSYAKIYQLPIVALRFFTVYGPRQRPDLVIHKFTRLMNENKPIPIYGDGTTSRDYTYIQDITQGILAAIEYNPPNLYDVFNLGNSETVSLQEVVKLLERYLGKKAQIKCLPAQLGDVPQTWANTKKAEHLLGFKPKTPITRGLKAFIDWFKETG